MRQQLRILAIATLALLAAACAPMAPAPTDTSAPVPPPRQAPEPPPAVEERPTIRSGEPRQAPNSAVASLLDQGWTLYRRDDFQGALGVASRAQRIDSRSPEVYLLMASAQFSLYQLAVAEQVARKGLAFAQSGSPVSRQLQSLLARIAASR